MSMFARVAGVLVDLSGTVHIGGKVVGGAIEAVEQLRQANIPFRFCTNTTKESKAELVNRLDSLGISVREEEVFTSLTACAHLLRKRQYKNPFYLLTDSAREEVHHQYGSKPTAEENDAVVVGLSPSHFNYPALNKAFRILHQGAPLIAVHRARYMQTEDGLSMGPGPFVEALEYAASVKAEVVGKPERAFFEAAIRSMNLDPAKDTVCMIGDDIEQDLGGGAVDLRIRRYLVQTGKYRDGDENRGEEPDEIIVVKGIKDAVVHILQG
ncbi:HAD-like domain-containing protein [Piptocephalis cylindrospora]|uniref:Haloacid dehalogenase-like hydrolase domain-containing protein 2 n=1 Tax=Piptocephalis cylindrospora TaxID=1907219 RepID=A0A4P9Y5D5_9FUNG|nr:HAD-like domain-containing protein [Piptocephalis cylindrospora]|eukprot:RKP14155.1 HAD-like domain-containing protein [Piptocephalis cylindrospora]